MYGHQVIEDLKLLINKDSKNIDLYSQLIKDINKSIHFYIGEAININKILGDKLDGKPIFNNELSELIRLPYKYCWFDYDLPPNNDKETESTKRGILAIKLRPEIIFCNIFLFANYFKHWMHPICYFMIIIGDTTNNIREKYKEIDKFLTIQEDESTKNNKTNLFCNLYKEYSGITPEEINDTYGRDLSILNEILLLLSCKNITTESHEAPVKLNKVRAKKGKGPLFTYHTLKLMPLSQKTKNTPCDSTGDHYRLHFCRGHFKRFTEDKPLFGRLTGLYWWQPHLRGQDTSGFVDKDYEVIVK